VRHQAELGEPVGPRLDEDRRSVREQLGARTELVAVVVGDPSRVRDERIALMTATAAQ